MNFSGPQNLSLTFFSEALKARGVDPDALLAPFAEEDRSELDLDPRIWQAAAEATGHSRVGIHLASAIESRAANVLVYLAMSSATLEDALSNLVRYAAMADQRGGRLSLRRVKGELHVGFGAAGAPDRIAHHTEFNGVLLHMLCRFVVGEAFTARELRLRHSRPELVEGYEFFGCPVRFRARRNTLVVTGEVARWRSLHADPAMLSMSRQYAEKALEAIAEDNLVGHVKLELEAVLETGPRDLESVARRMGMSGRSLQRRLKREGTGFAEVLDQVRRVKALELIEDRRVGLGALAIQSGFTDTSSLYRAFKRWTGRTPQQWRAR